MSLDFTLPVYRRLIESLQKKDYHFYTFADFTSLSDVKEPYILLRHDVDRWPSRTAAMAELEAEMGVRSTYFFRTKKVSFVPEVIEKTQRFGHEIGYHYECLSDTRGDKKAAWELFQKELKRFEPFCEVQSIAMHGRPLLPYDNRDIWQDYSYKDLGLKCEPYFDIDYKDCVYFTDPGRRWDDQANLRDRAEGADQSAKASVRTTDDLIKFIDGQNGNLVISTHPERWAQGVTGWAQVYATDFGINIIKKVLKAIR